VGVDPENANFLILATVEFGDSGDGPRGEGMVSTQHQRSQAVLEALHDSLSGADAGIRNLLKVSGVGAAKVLGFRDFDANIAAVADLVPKSFKTCFETGDSHRRGPHVHTATAGAEIERHSKDADSARREGLGSTC